MEVEEQYLKCGTFELLICGIVKKFLRNLLQFAVFLQFILLLNILEHFSIEKLVALPNSYIFTIQN